jgi:hypothetical protein
MEDNMKPRYAVIPLVAALFTPLLVHFALETFVGVRSPPPLFARPALDPALVVMTAIPFVALIVLVWMISVGAPDLPRNARRIECVFWAGLIAELAFMVYAYWTLMYPLYAGERVSSTHALGFLAAVFWGCLVLPLGLLIGWGISFLAVGRSSE